MGTAELACPSLAALTRSASFQVVAAVTQPDRPKGRELKLQPSPVKMLALSKSLPILQPARARSESFVQELELVNPDLIVVAAYGQILPGQILELPRFGCLNVHASLLPKYRGAAPIQWAILNGETETGVTIMKMDQGLDTGDILTTDTTPITAQDDSQTLHQRLAALGAALLLRTIPEYVSGNITPRRQPAEGVSFARKITREDGRLDWTQPALALWNRIRALVPWPGAYSFLPASPKLLLKIWQAEPVECSSGQPGEIVSVDKDALLVRCARGALRIRSLQREGGKRLTVRQFLTGHPLKVGDRLG